MLNLDIYDPDDITLLQKSYDAIKGKEMLQIVEDEDERKKVLRQTMNSISLPPNCNFYFQNLFKLRLTSGSVYIAQCVNDFGFSTDKNRPSGHDYHLQLIGIANLKIDLGKTLLRPETKTDKVIGYFYDHDIDLAGADRFNDKYYLASNRRSALEKVFDKSLTDAIGRYENVLLSTLGTAFYIHFPQPLSARQSAIVEDIFSHCNFLQ